jgi:hypothetical protein
MIVCNPSLLFILYSTKKVIEGDVSGPQLCIRIIKMHAIA